MRLTRFGRLIPFLLVLTLLAACASPQTSTPAASTAPAASSATPQTAAQTAPQTAPQTASQPASATSEVDATTAAAVPVTGGTGTAAAVPGAVQSTPEALACTSPARPIPALTEGPYFKAGSPENASLAGNLPGTRLILTGYVFDTNCKPVPGALLDFWQADSQGQYDNSGYTLRGHQFTDENGRYQLETVVPGLYPGRTEHIHFKVQAPGGPVLTSQLFFPNVNQNQSDQIFDPALVIQIDSDTNNEVNASFNVIIAAK